MKKERKLENVETGIDKTKTNSLFSIAMFGLLSLRILLDWWDFDVAHIKQEKTKIPKSLVYI